MRDDESLELVELPPKYRALGPQYPKPTYKTVAKFAFRSCTRASSRALHQIHSHLPKKQFRFTELPAELRQRIYTYALVHDRAIEINPSTPLSDTSLFLEVRAERQRRVYRKSLALGLLRTCRTVYLEAVPVFYGENHFECNYSSSWTCLEQWLAQIEENVNHLTRLYLYWPSPTWTSLRVYSPAPRIFLFLDSMLRPNTRLGTVRGAQTPEDLDNDAFQRVCKTLAEKKKLGAMRLWSWRGWVNEGFNTITFYRAVIVPAKIGPVTLAALTPPLVLGETARDGHHYAIQIERFTCRARGSHVRDTVEVVNYYVPGAISAPVP